MTVNIIQNWLISLKLPAFLAEIFGVLLALSCLALLVWLANYVTKRFITSVVYPLIKKSPTKWDDELIEHGVLIRFSHIVMAAVVHFLTPLIFSGYNQIIAVSKTVVNTYLVVIILLIIDSILNLVHEVWEQLPVGKRFPSKSVIQAAKLVINLMGCIFILSALLGKSPLVFFSGLGAITAILLLIFKDAILGLVAGFQLSLNNMVMVGDWIEMPARGADGDVIDVSLTTVKVQNWDKTITTIPTYALISDSFKNWRGMFKSGGRRIKRSINIDLRSIQFADEELLDRFKSIRILKSYLEERLSDIQKHNAEVDNDLTELINGRRLTNLGTFRAYCVAYLNNHAKIHAKKMTLIVRQLEPTQTGLPIQLYAFTSDTGWANYENIQADIFDHLFSILPEFKLRAFQDPSGSDLDAVLGKIR
ncbi:MAG: miniconductance mechanosensitive channel [Lentimonas sp.]|jgi:miniconductance mechanosensitive channel